MKDSLPSLTAMNEGEREKELDSRFWEELVDRWMKQARALWLTIAPHTREQDSSPT